MNHVFTALLLVLFSFQVKAQNVVLSGSITGSFPTLKAAFDAINAGGGSGNVVATIKGNTTETIQATLNQTGYIVQVVPEGNRIVEGNLTTPLVMLFSADNVTIDGQSLAGANTLTFRNINTGSLATVIRLQDGASQNIIRKCIIEGSANGSSVQSSALLIGTGTAGDNNNNAIDSNLVRPSTASGLTYGIAVGSGNTSLTSTFNNTQITNNLIENVFSNVTNIASIQSTGILIRNNTINTLVRGNSIYNNLAYNNTVVGANYWAIRVNSLNTVVGTGNIIDSNYIGGTAPVCAGGKMIFNSPNAIFFFSGIFLDENITAANSSVTRNIIRNLNVETTNTQAGSIYAFIGIRIVRASLKALNGNTVGDVSNESINIVMKLASAYSMSCFGILNQTQCATPVANNFIGGIHLTATGAAGITGSPHFYGLYQAAVANVAIKKNTVGSALANSIFISSTAPSIFNVSAIFNEGAITGSDFHLDSNNVRNITASRTVFDGITQENYGTGATATMVTINGNSIADIALSAPGGTSNGISYFTDPDVTSLVQNLTISGNQINNISATSGNANSLRGIAVTNLATALNRMKGRIENNTVTNMANNAVIGVGGFSSGISYANDIIVGDSMVVASNSVSGIYDAGATESNSSTANSNGVIVGGLNSSTNGLAIIRDNKINEIVASSAENGAIRAQAIAVYGNAAVVERNQIYDIQNAGQASTARIEGILLRSSSDDFNSSVVKNNMIALTANTGAQMVGIRLQDGSINANIYHNSILIEGTSAANSYAVYKAATALADVKNNILYNAATGAGIGFAIGLQSNANGYSGNNNYLVSPVAESLTSIGSASHTLLSWQTATGDDAASQERLDGVISNPANLFTNKAVADLFINTTDPTEAAKPSNAGMPLSAFVPTDFLNGQRSITTPDIGAHEFNFLPGIYWTGNVSSEWENPANWGNFKVPNATTDVIIPTGRPHYPLISVSTSVKSISAATATSVHVAAGITVLINGH